MNFQGVFTALITPFKEDRVDEEGLLKNVEYQLAAEVSGLVALGTTGESSTLSIEEQQLCLKLVLDRVQGSVPVIAGCSGNCTRSSIERGQKFSQQGASALLIVAPYYSRPTQQGIYHYFKSIAENVPTPIILYNNPIRSAVSISTETALRLSEIPNVVGIKDCSGSPMQMSEYLSIPAPFTVLSGDDIATLALMSLGGGGVISSLSNLVPHKIVALVRALQNCDIASARTIHRDLLPLFQACALEPLPTPLKEMMNQCQLPAGPCRSPLAEVSPQTRQKITQLLKRSR